MVFCNKKEQLYLETGVLGVSLGTILQVMDGIQLLRIVALYNATLWPIAFTSKSLISTEVTITM